MVHHDKPVGGAKMSGWFIATNLKVESGFQISAPSILGSLMDMKHLKTKRIKCTKNPEVNKKNTKQKQKINKIK